MARIQSYVFLDLETTSIPQKEHNRTRITELSMVVVKREHILDTKPGELPRVQHKLTMCFNPGRMIEQGSTDASGLDNDLLEHETKFNLNTYNTINSFLECQPKPVCLIAQNGHSFDFPILKNHLEKLNVALPDYVMCADSLHAYFDILEKERLNGSTTSENKLNPEILTGLSNTTKSVLETSITDVGNSTDNISDLDEQLIMQKQNESTPIRSLKVRAPKNIKEVRRKIYFRLNDKNFFPKPKESFRLKDIYERVLGRPAIDAHRAENDCLMTAEISVAKAKEFINWIDDNYCPFSEIKAMTPGVPIGY